MGFLAVPELSAQPSPRAKKSYDQAMNYQYQKKYDKARQSMAEAVAQDPGFTDAQSTLSEWYFTAHEFAKARDVLADAYKNNKAFAYPYAKSLVYTQKPAEALQIISSYMNTGRNEWKRLQEQAFFVQRAMMSPLKDTIRNLQRPNTPDPEMYPWINTDSSKLYFTRRINNIDEDFFYTTLDSCGGWYTGLNMGRPPNTLDQESAQMISADGHYLFYTKCEIRSANGWAQGGCDLFMSYRVSEDSAWSVPQSFGATINTPGYEGMGCLSADNRTLYFVSNREGGFGGLDIWMSKFENGLWQAPRNLGSSVNSSGDETAPYLHIDNHSLYFASNGRPGMGGSDLFMSRKAGDTSWTEAVNLGYPINTACDENSLCISSSGHTLYFASDRDSAAGNFDLYEVTLPHGLRPVPVAVIKGYVYDSLQKQRLNYASVDIQKPDGEESLYRFQSNRGDASYMITLPVGRKYICQTNRVSYQDTRDTLDLTFTPANTTYFHHIALLPYDYIAPVNDSLVLTIRFPRNKTQISDTDRQLLGQVMLPWLDKIESTMVFINGYTDNTGTPLINEQISYTRAGVIASELTAMGFHETNLKAQGWGEADPLVPNDSEQNQNLNRRVEIIIRR
ncbi:MAG TPA: OmpA family protein [Flavipsychrobacter sp.]|nr:OmpA family protein [Flavipsychrobacter sp.]